jgi:hypothetical protein
MVVGLLMIGEIALEMPDEPRRKHPSGTVIFEDGEADSLVDFSPRILSTAK